MENSTDSDRVPQNGWVCSVDVGPDRNGSKYLNRTLQEHYFLKQAVNLRQGPRYPAYCSLIDRVRSFENIHWPETNPTPVSLAESGFFYDGELTAF
jgi:hypothetical protein